MAKKKSSDSSPSSMTGFASSTATIDDTHVEVAFRSINHRFLDVTFKLPRECGELESTFRSRVQDKIQRGRVEVLVYTKTQNHEHDTASTNKKRIERVVREYSSLTKELGIKHGDPGSLIMHLLLKENGNSHSEKTFSAHGAKELSKLVEKTLDALLIERAKEGQALSKVIKTSLKAISENIKKIAELSHRGPQLLRKKLLARLKALKAEVGLDSARLATESALLAEKLDISEEISRINAHIKACDPLLKIGNQGKRLEFFAQELHREFTTLSGKSQDAQIQALAVAGRVEVEKIREQAQNLE